MEDELDGRLFERSTRRVELTAAGRRMLDQATVRFAPPTRRSPMPW